MKMKICQIAQEIFSGYTFRKGISNDPDGDCAVVQMSSFNPSYTAIAKPLLKIKSNAVSEKQFLNPGDVLFCAKGNNNFAFVFNHNYCAIAASFFFIIRVDKERINPEYLAWYINQEATQGKLHPAKEGTSVHNISKKSLEDLQIKIPPISIQNNLINIYKLWQAEKTKTIELLNKKQQYYNRLLFSEINKN